MQWPFELDLLQYTEYLECSMIQVDSQRSLAHLFLATLQDSQYLTKVNLSNSPSNPLFKQPNRIIQS